VSGLPQTLDQDQELSPWSFGRSLRGEKARGPATVLAIRPSSLRDTGEIETVARRDEGQLRRTQALAYSG
jgi:hypothetical protein